jgi:hypothetical protein
MPADEAEGVPTSSPPKRLRSACDACHASKMRCFGGSPCVGCQGSGIDCLFSVRNRLGRPKGVRNKHQAPKNGNTSNKSKAGRVLAPSISLPVSNNANLLHGLDQIGFAVPKTSARSSEQHLETPPPSCIRSTLPIWTSCSLSWRMSQHLYPSTIFILKVSLGP